MDKRVKAKQNELQKKREEQMERERKEREAKLAAEKEVRRLAGDYFPERPSVPYEVCCDFCPYTRGWVLPFFFLTLFLVGVCILCNSQNK